MNNIIFTLGESLNKKMFLFTMFSVLNLNCHVREEIDEIKIIWRVKFGNIV